MKEVDQGSTGERSSRPAPGAYRDRRLDRLRGLAVLLMLVDHLLVFAPQFSDAWFFSPAPGSPTWWTRHTLTRLSMPLFMLVSGFLLHDRPPSRRRRLLIGVLGGLLTLLLNWSWPAFGVPEILVVWSLVMLLTPLLREHPLEMLVLGVLQQLYLPVSWQGYQPGLVAAFLAAGVLWRRLPAPARLLEALGDALPSFFATVGRRPLLWYATHLTFLALLAWAFTSRG